MDEQIINETFWSEYANLYAQFYPSFQIELLSHIGKKSFGKVGDFGTGTGKLFRHLGNNPDITELIAIDGNEQMLNIAKQEATKYLGNINHKIERNELNSEQTQQLGSNFDSIYLINVLYANNNPIQIIENISKQIKCGGKLIIVDMPRQVDGEKLLTKMQAEYPNNKNLIKYVQDNQILMKDSVPSTYNLRELEKIITLVDNYTIEESSSEFFFGSVNYVLATKHYPSKFQSSMI